KALPLAVIYCRHLKSNRMRNMDRKKFLNRLGMSVGGSILGTSLIASFKDPDTEDCKVTPVQELGPYPVMKYRTQPDHDVDLTRFEGQAGIAVGQIITVFGRITNKACEPVS